MQNYSKKKINGKKAFMGTYCKEVNFEEEVVADLLSTCSFIFLLLVKKTSDL